MVVLYHTGGVHALHHPELQQSLLFKTIDDGWLGVSLFFVVSGFCITNAAVISLSRDAGVGPFFRARLRRIFPPYWGALALYLLLLQATSLLVSLGVLPSNGLAESQAGLFLPQNLGMNLTLTQFVFGGPSILPVSWTLCFELAFYGLVGLALAGVGRRWGARNLLRALHLLTLTCLLLQLFIGKKMVYPFQLWGQFGLGAVVYDILTASRRREPWFWGAGIFIATLFDIAYQDILVVNQPLRLSMLVALGFAAILLVAHRYDSLLAQHRTLAGLSRIGVFSYSLYLTHHYILRVALQLFDKLRLPDPGGMVGLAFGTLASIGFAVLFYRFLEKPFLKKRPKASP
jgi:exopolysaccharide production protein ExoZ